mgnify:CR=1 FL=1
MNKYLFAFLFSSLFSISFLGLAQKVKRVEPGVMYMGGETLSSPKFGFTTQVPQNWVGTLPRETEVFLLNLSTGQFGEIFVVGRPAVDLNEVAEEWKAGVDLTETLRLQADNPQIQDNALFSEVKAVGNYIPTKKRAFAMVRCGDTGTCITVLAVSSDENYDLVSQAAKDFLANGKFQEPREIDPFEDFDWQEFLSNKMLIVYNDFKGGERKTRVNLCADGSFNAKVKKKGFMKDFNPEYKGNMSGSWTVESNNSEATMNITFSKGDLRPLTVQLKFVDEQLYVNDERFYASQSENCK